MSDIEGAVSEERSCVHGVEGDACLVCVEGNDAWGWRARYLQAEQEASALRQERDAYKKAKAENDDRFMCERDAARADLAATQRELERWRHGVTIEGDFVCPDSLALADRDQQLATIEAEVVEQVAAWLYQARRDDRCSSGLLDEFCAGAWRKP